MTKRVLARAQTAPGKMPNVFIRFGNKVSKEGLTQVFVYVYLGDKRVQFQTGVYVTAWKKRTG